jgi:hypothetical protein
MRRSIPSAVPVQEEIGHAVAEILKGTGLRFGLVLWVPGKPADADALSIVVAEVDRDEVGQALRAAADIADLVQAPGGRA